VSTPQKPKPRRVRLTQIERREELQFRGRTSPQTVETYRKKMRGGEVFPPVTLARLGKRLLLVDGWHRVEALDRLRQTHVEAEVRPVKSLEDARYLSAIANATHGKPLANKDIRRMFRAYMDAGQNRKPDGGLKSARDIAADLHHSRSHVTILDWMEGDYPSIWDAMRRKKKEDEEAPRSEAADEAARRRADEERLGGIKAAIKSLRGLFDQITTDGLKQRAAAVIQKEGERAHKRQALGVVKRRKPRPVPPVENADF